MIYDSHVRNHVILPGRGEALEAFLRQDYNGMQHKWRNAVSSNSEDALTWSVFDVLAHLEGIDRAAVIDEMLHDAFEGRSPFSFRQEGISSSDIRITVGQKFTGAVSGEATEVDAVIEAPGVLVFFEAKLYSAVSGPKPPAKPQDQIARKLRVGLDVAAQRSVEFLFVFLDIAPPDLMYERRPRAKALAPEGGGYKDKWRSAWLFKYYKRNRNGGTQPLADALQGVPYRSVNEVAARMGWLTWADLFKTTLRAVLSARS